MVAEGSEPKRITRSMYAKRGRKSIIIIGTVRVEIVPVSCNGYPGWEVVMPDGAKIAHQTLTQPPAKP